MVAEAWNLVRVRTLRIVWNKLKGTSAKEETQREGEARKRNEKQEEDDVNSENLRNNMFQFLDIRRSIQ